MRLFLAPDFFRQNPGAVSLLLSLSALIVLLSLCGRIAGGAVRLIVRASRKSGGKWGEWFAEGFRRPLAVLTAGIGFYVALRGHPYLSAAWPAIDRSFRSFLVVTAAWGFYRMADPGELSRAGFPGLRKGRGELLPAVSGAARFFLIALAVLIIAQEWNFSVSGLLAGLGLGGLAFALAARDMLSNLFGGIVILLDRPFTLGDWIRTGGVEGTVENINFRSVKIRTADQALVTVPNSSVVGGAVFNYSRSGKRLLEFSVSLLPGSGPRELKALTDRIRGLLEKDADLRDVSVALKSVGEDGPRLSVSCFVRTSDRGTYLRIRERVFYAVLGTLRTGKDGAPDGFRSLRRD